MERPFRNLQMQICICRKNLLNYFYLPFVLSVAPTAPEAQLFLSPVTFFKLVPSASIYLPWYFFASNVSQLLVSYKTGFTLVRMERRLFTTQFTAQPRVGSACSSCDTVTRFLVLVAKSSATARPVSLESCLPAVLMRSSSL